MRWSIRMVSGMCLIACWLLGCATDDEWMARGEGAGPGSVCDVIAQDCRYLSAPKCRIYQEDGTSMKAFCDVESGDDREGETCWATEGDPVGDTCARGLDCATVGVQRESPQPGRCYRFCDRPDGCDPGELCVLLNGTGEGELSPDTRLYGSCVSATCDFWDPWQCGTGRTCLRGRLIDNRYAYMCYPSDSGMRGEPCSGNQNCGAGLGCAWAGSELETCQPWCGDAHPTCGAKQHCEIFDREEDVGICVTD